MAQGRDWDAATYDRVSEPQVAMAHGVLERLALRGDEAVLDAGCGSGRVTRLLLERLPRGRVVAVDASAAMVEKAREALGDRATVLRADLTELVLPEPVDAAFSNAVFHWVTDHEALFARLRDALVPGGRLVAQCGGAGNIAVFHAVARRVADRDPYARWLGGWAGPWNFASAEDTAARLERAGFAEVRCWLEPRAVTPPDVPAYLHSVCLGPHVQQLPEELRAGFVADVAREAGDPLVLDYVRLNIEAVRA